MYIGSVTNNWRQVALVVLLVWICVSGAERINKPDLMTSGQDVRCGDLSQSVDYLWILSPPSEQNVHRLRINHTNEEGNTKHTVDVFVGKSPSDKCGDTFVTTCFNFRMSTTPAQSVPIRCDSDSGKSHFFVGVLHAREDTSGASEKFYESSQDTIDFMKKRHQQRQDLTEEKTEESWKHLSKLEIATYDLAYKRDAFQSSTFQHGDAVLAVDGNNARKWESRSCARTTKEEMPWWLLDLGKVRNVRQVWLHGMTSEDGEDSRLRDVYVGVGNESRYDPLSMEECDHYAGETQENGDKLRMDCQPARTGRFVAVGLRVKELAVLALCEVEVLDQLITGSVTSDFSEEVEKQDMPELSDEDIQDEIRLLEKMQGYKETDDLSDALDDTIDDPLLNEDVGEEPTRKTRKKKKVPTATLR